MKCTKAQCMIANHYPEKWVISYQIKIIYRIFMSACYNLQLAKSNTNTMQLSGDRLSILKYSDKMPTVSDLVYRPTQQNEGQLTSLSDCYDSHKTTNEAKTDGSNPLWATEVNQRQVIQCRKKEDMDKLIYYTQKQIVGRQKWKQASQQQLAIRQQPDVSNIPKTQLNLKKKDGSFTSNNSNVDIKIDSYDDSHDEKHPNEHCTEVIDKQLLFTFKDMRQKSAQKLYISKQVSIAYICQADLPPEKYSRFRSSHYQNRATVSVQSMKSSMTEEKSEGLYEVKPPFTKLHQIQLFLNMNESKHKRAQQLLHANQKILLAEHYLQKVIQNMRKELEAMHDKHSKKQLSLNNRLKEREGEIVELKAELQIQAKQMTKLKNLNELYLKQNNDLKKKHRDNFKEVQLLRKDLHLAIKQNSSDKIVMQTIPANAHRVNYKPNIVHKLKNCRSQEIVHQEYMLMEEGGNSPKCQIDLKSQKSYGKIHNNVQNSDQTKNGRMETGWINTIGQGLLMAKDKDDRSISSIASISGKSATHKIGFIAKAKDRAYKQGVMIDLLVQSASQKALKPLHQKDQQLFKFKTFRKETLD